MPRVYDGIRTVYPMRAVLDDHARHETALGGGTAFPGVRRRRAPKFKKNQVVFQLQKQAIIAAAEERRALAENERAARDSIELENRKKNAAVEDEKAERRFFFRRFGARRRRTPRGLRRSECSRWWAWSSRGSLTAYPFRIPP